MKMKAASSLSLAAVLVGGVSCQMLLEQNITEVEFAVSSMSTASGASGDESAGGATAAADLVQALEGDNQVTVTGAVELGEISCASLENATDASALAMTMNGERLVAGQTSYSFTDGEIFDDGVGRHTLLLKITKRNNDGTATVVKTVPCLGSTTQTCVVEVTVDFEEAGDAVMPESATADTTDSNSTASGTTRRRMQEGGIAGYTVIDVMILFSKHSLALLGGVSIPQMLTIAVESIVWTNQAFINSQAAVRFRPVAIGLLPYEYDEENALGVDTLLELRRNEDVGYFRDLAAADLVQLIGYFGDLTCGIGYVDIHESLGYSVVKPTCLDNHIHTHWYGHNLGCRDDRSSAVHTEYSHGLRYCDGIAPYRTIMTRAEMCAAPVANYFSNPDVTYLAKPTGTPTEDNVRTIEDNMVAVSNYRPIPAPTPSPITPTIVPVTPTVPPANPPSPSPIVPTYPPVMPTEFPVMPTLEPVTATVTPEAAPTATPAMTPLPSTSYTSVGCYADRSTDRVLSGAFVKGDGEMTTEKCAMLCEGSAYFGTEYTNECFCGPSTDDPTRLGPATCNFPCAGDAAQTCGGYNAISVYEYLDYPFVGCFKDSSDRVLSGAAKLDDPAMTTEACAEFCEGSPYFGTEFGQECFCAEESDDPDELGPAVCNFECSGDPTQTCGGILALSVYTYPDSVVSPPTNTTDPTSLGCWGDSRNERIMMHKLTSGSMTNEICYDLCSGYTYFGTQYAIECWCGDESTDYMVHGASTDCTFGCGGDPSLQICGGFFAMSVWEY
eukprot:jgi/Undpi1/4357/HiC_scaffold_17.g07723.m1